MKGCAIETVVGRGIFLWMALISGGLAGLIRANDLDAKIYRFGPNPDLYILGFCIDDFTKYAYVASFCLVNSGIRTLNGVILHSWIINQVRDISKPATVSRLSAYEISCVSCIYNWFDFFMYMNILLTQIDMMFIEIGADLIMTSILTSYYLHAFPRCSDNNISTYVNEV
jgi:hypothetical protein